MPCNFSFVFIVYIQTLSINIYSVTLAIVVRSLPFHIKVEINRDVKRSILAMIFLESPVPLLTGGVLLDRFKDIGR